MMLRATAQNAWRRIGLPLALASAIAASAGCNIASNHSDAYAPPSAADVAAGQQKAMHDIEANPHIPAQVKQNVLRQMRGQFKPAEAPGTPPAKH